MIRLFHGPLRERVAAPGQPAGDPPVFGIVPRALVRQAGDLESATGIAWPEAAPQLESALTGGGCPESLRPWRDAARADGVLAWRDAAAACGALAALLEKSGEARLACGARSAPQDIDFWLVKEGHTSSVWQICLHLADGTRVQRCLNVARDAAAALEIESTSRELQRLHAVDPDHVADVALVEELPLAGRPVERATVTVGPWIPGNELHVAPAAPAGGVLEIGWFLSPGAAGRQRLLGRRLPAAEAQEIRRQWLRFLDRHHTRHDGGRIGLPRAALNEGDLLWTGDRLVVVALCEQALVLDAGIWAALQRSADGWLRLGGVLPLPNAPAERSTN